MKKTLDFYLNDEKGRAGAEDKGHATLSTAPGGETHSFL